MWTIARRELFSLLLSPLAWVVLALMQAVLAWFFMLGLDYYLYQRSALPILPEQQGFTFIVVHTLFDRAGVLLLLIAPLLSMRLISEERRQQRLALLLTAPLSNTQIVLGKYLGLLGFFSLLSLLLSLMPLSLLAGGSPDWGHLAAALLGFWCLAAAATAVGLYFSAISPHPALAAIGSFGVLLMLWLLDWSGAGVGVVGALSLYQHYQGLLSGVINSADLSYFFSLTGIFLILSAGQLRRLVNP